MSNSRYSRIILTNFSSYGFTEWTCGYGAEGGRCSYSENFHVRYFMTYYLKVSFSPKNIRPKKLWSKKFYPKKFESKKADFIQNFAHLSFYSIHYTDVALRAHITCPHHVIPAGFLSRDVCFLFCVTWQPNRFYHVFCGNNVNFNS